MAGGASQKTLAAALDLRRLLFRPGAVWPGRPGRAGIAAAEENRRGTGMENPETALPCGRSRRGPRLDGDGDGRRKYRRGGENTRRAGRGDEPALLRFPPVRDSRLPGPLELVGRPVHVTSRVREAGGLYRRPPVSGIHGQGIQAHLRLSF